ncbi:MAG: hypothetical protein Q9201_003291 [Fulgogasparrea decipioides]
MPFTLFKTPSTSKRPPVQDAFNSTIYPSPLTTQTIIALILERHHPSRLCHISAPDIQQFLTELYGCEPSLHWTWIGCTFSPTDVKYALENLPKDYKDKPARSQRKALIEFVKNTQAEEVERKGRLLGSQTEDARNAYLEGEKKRKEQEIGDLERIMWVRLKKEPVVAKVVYTDGHPIVYYESA